MRWLIFLNKYNITMKYYSESENNCADTLFWRNQNNLNEKDEWMFHWFFQLLKSISASLSDNEKDRTEAVLTMTVIMTFIIMTSISTDKYNRIKWLWIFFAHDDKNYTKAWQAIKKETKQFPSELNLKALITECQINNDDTL